MRIFGPKKKQLELEDARPPDDEINLFHDMPMVFENTLKEYLVHGEEVLAVLFVPSEHVLDTWTPGKALVVTGLQVMVMEEGESVIADTRWGVKTRFYAYHQIAAIEMGYALLRGRFRIACANSCEDWEIRLHWYDLSNFRAAAKLIRQRIASVGGSQTDRERNPESRAG